MIKLKPINPLAIVKTLKGNGEKQAKKKRLDKIKEEKRQILAQQRLIIENERQVRKNEEKRKKIEAKRI